MRQAWSRTLSQKVIAIILFSREVAFNGNPKFTRLGGQDFKTPMHQTQNTMSQLS
jgi:hypothetical protein